MIYDYEHDYRNDKQFHHIKHIQHNLLHYDIGHAGLLNFVYNKYFSVNFDTFEKLRFSAKTLTFPPLTALKNQDYSRSNIAQLCLIHCCFYTSSNAAQINNFIRLQFNIDNNAACKHNDCTWMKKKKK